MAATLSFERIKKMPQKAKDIVSGFIGRNNIKNSFHIPKSVYYTILLFYWRSLQSEILTDDESEALLDLFQAKHKFKHYGDFNRIAYELIYQSYAEEEKETSFKRTCHSKKNLLCIIHTKSQIMYLVDLQPMDGQELSEILMLKMINHFYSRFDHRQTHQYHQIMNIVYFQCGRGT